MKTPYLLILSAVLTSTLALNARAKPLSYVGGTMVMQENDETGYSLSIDYTASPKFGLGVSSKYEIGGDEFYTAGAQLNLLLKRWNLPGGQGNIVGTTGAGFARDGSDDQPMAWAALRADYETRRVFFSYEPRVLYAGDIEKSFWQRASAGFAPYLADYEHLNTWLLIRADHHPAKRDDFVVTPFIRFFYKTIWLEAGYSSNNHVMVNWTVQF